MKNEPDLEQLQRKILQNISEMGFLERMWRQNKVVVIVALILLLSILVVLYMAVKPSAASRPAAAKPVVERAAAAAVPPAVAASDKTSIEANDGTMFEGDIRGSVTVVVKGEEQGTYPITTTPMILGRDAGASSVVIQSELASKSHLKIYPKGDQFCLVDLGSTNGTYVNGERITETLISPDDAVQLGKKGEVKLVFTK